MAQPNPSNDHATNEMRLILVGRTGSGKSSTGNTILGEEYFKVRHSVGSKDKREVKTCRSSHVALEIVDTPGLFDTEVSHEDTAFVLVKAIRSLSPGPHAILYVIKIGRFTEEELSAYEVLKALFDSDISKHMIVIFTGGDYLKRDKSDIEDCLKLAPEQLQKMLRECGNRYVVFDNTAQEKKSQANHLFAKIDELKKERESKPFITPYVDTLGDERLKEGITKRLRALGLSQIEYEDKKVREKNGQNHLLAQIFALALGIVGVLMGSPLEHMFEPH